MNSKPAPPSFACQMCELQFSTFNDLHHHSEVHLTNPIPRLDAYIDQPRPTLSVTEFNDWFEKELRRNTLEDGFTSIKSRKKCQIDTICSELNQMVSRIATQAKINFDSLASSKKLELEETALKYRRVATQAVD